MPVSISPRALALLFFLTATSPGFAETPSSSPVFKPQQLTAPDEVPKGLQKSDWASIRAAHAAWQHSFKPAEDGWMARNQGQQWTMKFDGRGFLATPRDGDWTWGLELRNYGVGASQRPVGKKAASVKAEGQRLSYQWDENLQEWWVNDARGLEHGYTVGQRPSGERSTNLELTMATRGTLKPVVSADHLGVLFQDGNGVTVLNYNGLKVWDADGRELASHFESEGQMAVRLIVEDTSARYPLTIDPIAQQAYVKITAESAGTANRYDSFGISVAVSGDTVVVGASGEASSTTGINSTPNELASSAGAAYVFVRNGNTWSQQAFIKASQATAFDFFGISVAVSGDTVVVGAYGEDSSTSGVNSTPNELASAAGAAYVFVRNGSTWSQQAYLKASQVTGGDFFGNSLAVSGDTVVVGANREASSTTGVNGEVNEDAIAAGAAYVFVRSGKTWSQQAYLKASQVTAGDNFGISLAVSGDTVVVGAYGEDSSMTGVNSTPNENAETAGAAYVFVRSGSTWNQQAYLKASQVTTGDFFGISVAVSGDTVVVGANGEDSSTTGVNSAPDELVPEAGAAYVFVRSGSSWTQQAYVKASQATVLNTFGNSVAVSGDTLVVGAKGEASSTTGINSSPVESAWAAGAAYVFVRSGSTWSQQAYLKASQVTADDFFGTSVAVSGDTVVVGASAEDSSTTGINSTPNESSEDSGAAYVFVRSASAWSQQAYVKTSAESLGAAFSGDGFGRSVAVSGNTVVVGAYGEDSSSTGVNSTPNENAEYAGAAYVFVRNGSTWSQQAYLKASQVTAGDTFGNSVAVSEDTVVVGAGGEDSSTTGVNSTPNENAEWAGAAYVFVRNGSTWSQQAYLKASQVTAFDFFGNSVEVSGDTVVVGAGGEDSSTTGVNSTPNENAESAGAAYVFVRNGSTWSQQAYLKASEVTAGDIFGVSVAVSGETLVVGASGEDSSTTGVNSTPNENAESAGAAYVFVRNGITWSQQAYLKASQVTAGDLFAYVAVNGDTVVVGAYGEDSSTTGVNSTPNENAEYAGAAYVFVRNGSTWSQQAYLKASEVTAGDIFGVSVAVSGETLVVGASGEDSSTTGVNSTPNENAESAGAAYVFVRNGSTWSQQAYLKASQVTAGDAFGEQVDVSGDTVVVGAYGESSSITGINSTPDENAEGAGAAYIFSLPLPTVTTPTSVGVMDDVATLGGSVDNDGGSTLIERGIVYSLTTTNADPQIGGLGVNKVPATGITGNFTVGVTGLAGLTGYSYRAYAANSYGTTYSNMATFTTLISANADLSDLQLSSGILTPTFASGTAHYMATVNYSTTSVLITPTPVQLNSKIEVRINDGSYAIVASGSPSEVQTLNVGSNQIEVRVTAQAANTKTYRATVIREKALQSIIFAAIPDKLTTDSVNLTATGGGSNLPVTFVVTSGAGVITNNVLTFTTSGNVTVTASQVGKADYLAAEEVSRSFTVTKTESPITLAQLTQVANGTARPVTASTTPADLTVKTLYAGSTTAPTLPGTYAVTTTIESLLYQGTASGTLTVLGLSGLEQPILIGSTVPATNNGTDYGNVTLGRVLTRVFTLLNPGSQPVSLSSNPLVEMEGAHTGDFQVSVLPETVIPAGGSVAFEVRFAPTQPGLRTARVKLVSAAIANGPLSFAVQGFGSLPAPRAQTITFAPPATVYMSQSPLQLTATSSSGLPVTLQVISGPATLGQNGVLNLASAGTVKVEARQAGNGSFAAAPALLRTITAKADPTTLTLVDLIKTYNGQAQEVGIVGANASDVVVTYRVGTTYREELPVNAGQYPVKAVAGSVTKTGTLIINPAPLYVTADDKRRLVGEDNPALTVLFEGFIGADNLGLVLSKSINLATTASKISPVGSYAITSSGGAVTTNYKLVHRPGTLVVEGVAGSFEALLKQSGSGLPNGHLALTVPATGRTFTASLRLGQESAAIAYSGNLTLSPQSRLATATLSKTVAGVAYELKVVLSMFGELNVEVRRAGVLVAEADDGIRLLTLPTGQKSAQEGSYTAILEPALPAGQAVPVGAGWATVKVDATGKMTLTGKLADGTAFTTGVAADVAEKPGYRFFVQPYATLRKDSYVGGSFTLVPHPRLAGKSYVAGSNLTWVKVGQLKDLGYRSGFGPVTSTLRIDPWQAPTTTHRLATQLELGVDERWQVEHSSTGSLSQAALPTLVGVNATNVVSVVLPPPNTRKWKVTITPTTGAYTGSFELQELTESRTVNFSGVLRQTPTLTDDLIGAGHYLLPALKAAPSNEQTSGALLFWRPE